MVKGVKRLVTCNFQREIEQINLVTEVLLLLKRKNESGPTLVQAQQYKSGDVIFSFSTPKLQLN